MITKSDSTQFYNHYLSPSLSSSHHFITITKVMAFSEVRTISIMLLLPHHLLFVLFVLCNLILFSSFSGTHVRMCTQVATPLIVIVIIIIRRRRRRRITTITLFKYQCINHCSANWKALCTHEQELRLKNRWKAEHVVSYKRGLGNEPEISDSKTGDLTTQPCCFRIMNCTSSQRLAELKLGKVSCSFLKGRVLFGLVQNMKTRNRQ